jgi:AraC-like DNA-binding protein
MTDPMRTSLVLISLLGAAQALLLAGALVVRPVHRTANRVLALLLVSMAIYLGNGAYHAADLVARWPFFFRWGHPLPLLFGPLVYLYARFVTDASRRVGWRDALHFLPAIAVIAWSLPVYLLPATEKLALYDAIRAGNIPPNVAQNLAVSSWLKLCSGVAYSLLTVRVTLAHRRAIRARYSTLDRITLDWLLTLAVASVLVWGIAVLARFGESAGVVRVGLGDHLIVLLMTAATYVIGYRGLHQSVVRPVQDAAEIVPTETIAVDDAPGLPKTERSSLSPGMARALEERLHAVMRDEAPWRESGLTLSDLAARVGTTTHKLSELLNSRVEQTFHDYVNGFRVREVQRLLTQPTSSSRTLLAIALEAGFASKSTFNAVFRREVGMTPTAWRAAQAASDTPPTDADVRTDPSGRPAR